MAGEGLTADLWPTMGALTEIKDLMRSLRCLVGNQQRARLEYVTHIFLHGLSEHPPAGFQSCSVTNPKSETEERVINNPKGHSIEDDILENTIPVVSEVVCTIGSIRMQSY